MSGQEKANRSFAGSETTGYSLGAERQWARLVREGLFARRPIYWGTRVPQKISGALDDGKTSSSGFRT